MSSHQIHLIKTDANANNNKFYRLTLNEDNTYTANWGRVGASGQMKVYVGGRDAMTSAARRKESKGYERVNVVSSAAAERHTMAPATDGLNPDGHTNIADFLRTIERANHHAIASSSGGRIEVDEDGLVTTALGVVESADLRAARSIIEKAARSSGSDRWTVRDAEKFLRLAPQKVRSVRSFYEDVNPTEQMDFIDQLITSVDLYEARLRQAQVDASGESDEAANPFRYTLHAATDEQFAYCQDKFNRGINRHHQRAAGMKLESVIAVRDDQLHQDRWDTIKKDSHDWSRRLWHGTRTENLLSILFKGFYVPTSGSGPAITGRMFGDGVYFAPSATKSLNYAIGGWGGSRTNTGYMLLNDVITGWEYRTTGTDSRTGALDAFGRSNKHHSLYVNAGTCGVINTEVIVPDPDRVKVSFICKFAG